MKKSIIFGTIALIIGVLIGGCGASVSDETILSLSGAADESWTERELKSFQIVEAEYEKKDGSIQAFEGISINELLNSAGVDGFTKFTLVASDGYTAEGTFEELIGCSNCIIVFQEESGLHVVMPGFSSKLQVKDLIELQVE